MTVTISNSQRTSTIELISGTICGYTDTKNILIFRLDDAEEIKAKAGEFEPFVNTAINVNADNKLNFQLTPIRVVFNTRSICYEFPQGEISWN